MMELNSSVSDKKTSFVKKCHFTNTVPFLFTVDFFASLVNHVMLQYFNFSGVPINMP